MTITIVEPLGLADDVGCCDACHRCRLLIFASSAHNITTLVTEWRWEEGLGPAFMSCEHPHLTQCDIGKRGEGSETGGSGEEEIGGRD